MKEHGLAKMVERLYTTELNQQMNIGNEAYYTNLHAFCQAKLIARDFSALVRLLRHRME